MRLSLGSTGCQGTEASMTQASAGIPLSATQLEIYLDQAIHEDVPLYNIGGYVVLEEAVDVPAFVAAYEAETHRHDAFAVRIRAERGVPMQYADGLPRTLAVLDFSGDPAPAERAMAWLDERFRRPFPLDDAALHECALIRTGPATYWYATVAHHLIIDGWGYGLWIRRLVDAYLARTGRSNIAPEPPSFLDGVASRRRRPGSTRELPFGNPPEPLLVRRIMGGPPRPSVRVVRMIDGERIAALTAFASMRGFAFHHFLLAMVYALFARQKRRGRFAAGIPMHNRRREEKDIVGSFVAVTPCVLDAAPDADIVDLMAMARNALAQATRRTAAEAGRGAAPAAAGARAERAYEVQFNYMRLDFETDGTRLATRSHFLANSWSQTPFAMHVCDLGSHQPQEWQVEVNEAWLSRLDAELILDRLTYIADQYLRDPALRLDRLETIPPAERAMLDIDWGRAPSCHDRDADIADGVVAACARRPNAIALRAEAAAVTYAALVERGRKLAGWLAARSLRPSAPIAVQRGSSVGTIVALFAALYLRRPYVPIDVDYPAERVRYIVGDAGAEWLLAGSAALEALGPLDARVLDLDDARVAAEIEATGPLPSRPEATDPAAAANRVAWIIYTSGSTGQPKGVVVPHAGVLRMAAHPNFMPLNADTVLLQTANVAFDVSTFEIWGTLVNGGTLVLEPMAVRDLGVLTRTLESEGVNTLWLTAGLFDKWVGTLREVPATLRIAMAGGDVVPPDAVRRLRERRPDILFVNGYGPTENGVFSACGIVEAPCDPYRSIPIGRPVNGSSVHVVDDEGRLLPFGEEGELWVGGEGVAAGYLNNTALTASRFLDHGAGDVAERIYRTGDRVRWREDGQLEYLGRIDQQVKVRGFRIELEEIEKHLRRHAMVAEACVVAIGSTAADKYLRAYVVPGATVDEDILTRDLAIHLRAGLPDYMVPAQIQALERLPLNANGKVDRTRLAAMPAPEVAMPADDGGADGTAATIRDIWQRALSVPPRSLDDEFFGCGGHSLAAMQVLAEINASFGLSLSIADILSHTTVRRQAELVDAQPKRDPVAATPVPMATESGWPLSVYQEPIWLAWQLHGAAVEYNLPGVFTLRGQVDAAALEEALRDVIARHQPLHCVIRQVPGEEPGAVAVEPSRFRLERLDLDGLEGDALAEATADAIRAERERPFDLTVDLPIRATLVAQGIDENLLLVTLHHVAVDGWSLRLFYEELAACYASRRQGQCARLPAVEATYGELVRRQRADAATAMSAAAVDYWRAYLDGAATQHDLPLSRPRHASAAKQGRTLHGVVPAQAMTALRGFAASEQVSVFSVLRTTFAVLVGEFSHARDVTMGTPVSVRPDRSSYGSIGCFVNTMAVRTRYAADASLREIIREADRDWTAHLAWHRLPYARVLDAMGTTSLFQLWFAFHSQAQGGLALDGLDAALLPAGETRIKFDLMIGATESTDGLAIEWQYDAGLFDAARMQDMLDAYVAMLVALPALAGPPLRGWVERLGLSAATAATPMQASVARQVSLADRVAAHARATPAAPALVDGDIRLDYAQLMTKVDRLSGLLAESGVAHGDRVAVCADRTLGGVVAILAIQALGAAYVPVDAKLPRERMALVLDGAGVEVVLTYAETSQRLAVGSRDVILLDGVARDEWLEGYAANGEVVAADADTVAYVIYTSGSTGEPKGVCVTRGNLAHYVAGMTERHGFADCRHYAVNSAFHTDLGNTTLYLGLWHGACLHLLAPELMLDGAAVGRYVRDHAIDVMKITPGHFAALCDPGAYEAPVPARLLIFGGEALREDLIETIAEPCAMRGCRIVNHYGPTETTIGCLTLELDARRAGGAVPLGRPLPGTSVRIMADGATVPMGAWGELVVGGPAVSQGYRGRDDLTAKVFFGEEGSTMRWYRTGDRARFDDDGNVVFGGRLDDQVKIRGFRIELAEIDACLLRLPGVRQAVTVVYRDDAGQEALGSAIVAPAGVAANAVEPLARTLPDYMLPRVVLALDEMPMLGNGKPDRRAVAALMAAQQSGEYLAPDSPTERTVHAAMAALLGRDRLSVTQSFFDAGGNSLLVTRLANELHARLGLRLPVRLLMENHSPRSLAAVVDALIATSPTKPAGEDIVEIEV
ncbi:MAG TPA: amino acid adenylation domain-containing protein [Steroidobacteraceae bacterium]|nr:amino acid adenylation domain-containing protein [Steroidobacteraceae bacterium]